ncbi:tetratricopeptide repeat protein [Nostoc sp. UCD121]|uniref:tetratricopeptide repeat protein n=1 Tax=unclassified Nostoc TaxID=2593658 RepID=UPI0016281715|nr:MULTISPECIES: tetratricopeptide repeat protein [unclassified Nostoc]MBC1223426.1 tetratricopeptide repeat protein [Nostoc sp. UCD120]MBC1275846.1 tetratricopeptide repeat protein [Nostoc sp. UCD121]MBC1295796.1 tetratricopeptide repeat protein [Nostoc sp. UCD122]
MLRRLIVIVTTAILFSNSLTLAQTKKPKPPDKFPPSPLEITTPDPLLPRLPKDKQPLTLQEQQNLEPALDALNQQAAAKLQAGDQVAAFEIWNRELRLRRFLGSFAEVQALSRVGAIAWKQNDGEEVQYITQRLQAIQKQVQSQKTTAQVDLELWRSLAQAYQNVRSIKLAVEAYDQVLLVVRQQKDPAAVVEMLKTIGELHLSWFDYTKAAPVYEELLSLATSQSERVSEVTYLQRLAYIYEQTQQPQQSLNVLNKLVEIYTSENNLTEIPELKLAIAANYESLAKKDPNLLLEAFQNYQEAYTTAWQLREYVRAGDALQKLIALYRSQGQIDEALQASQILVQIQTQSANFYGIMQAYDQIGQLYLEQKDFPQALTAFKKGLEIAQQLKHEEAYFTKQIEKVSSNR